MVVPVTLHIYAAAFPIACVDSAPPVPCRAGICVLVNDDAGSRERRAFSRQESVTLLQQAHGVRLAHRSRRQKARRPARKFCRTACWRFSRHPKTVWFHGRFHSGNNRNSVPLRELPPQRGPRQFSVERCEIIMARVMLRLLCLIDLCDKWPDNVVKKLVNV